MTEGEGGGVSSGGHLAKPDHRPPTTDHRPPPRTFAGMKEPDPTRPLDHPGSRATPSRDPADPSNMTARTALDGARDPDADCGRAGPVEGRIDLNRERPEFRLGRARQPSRPSAFPAEGLGHAGVRRPDITARTALDGARDPDTRDDAVGPQGDSSPGFGNVPKT